MIWYNINRYLSPDHYISLLYKSTVVEKIDDDVFRTFFVENFSEYYPQMTRILNAYANDQVDKSNRNYVQGMNMLLAPFCLVMPELDAYYAYRQFLNKFIPTYVCKLITGVHQGLRLMHECIKVVDEELYYYLKDGSKCLFMMPQILSFMTCNTPATEV